MNGIIAIVRKAFMSPAEVKIGDFGAAQGNMSLLLAEAGYKVCAFDINPSFIAYSKKKYEKGDIEWLDGNIETLDFPLDSLDVAIAGEIIEHCAYPEDILAKILTFVKPEGILIITTPNGSRILNRLPTFQQVSDKDERKVFVSRQFRPAGEDHLFLFRLEELDMIIPPGAQIIEKGYLGGTILYNEIDQALFRLLPARTVEKLIRFFSLVPFVNRFTYHNIFAVVKKNY